MEPVVVEQAKLEERITRALEAVDTSMSALDDGDLDLDNLDVTGDEDDQEEMGRDEIEDAPVVRFVNKVLLDAIKRGASDVHFEPYEKMFRVRTRLDGVLSEVATPPIALANKVCARLKVMSLEKRNFNVALDDGPLARQPGSSSRGSIPKASR